MARTSVSTRKNTTPSLASKTKAETPLPAASKQPPAGGMKTSWNEADRHQMINVAAYYLAEQRGFSGGDPVADWLAAEARIDAMLKKAGITRIH